jgi:hypothetical protein
LLVNGKNLFRIKDGGAEELGRHTKAEVHPLIADLADLRKEKLITF